MTTRTWLLVLMTLGVPVAAQQLADPSFRFTNAKPAFAAGKGPRACIDLAHHNFQSPGQNPGSYDPFAQLLRGDGYRVRETSQAFTSEMLTDCELLVIVLPVGRENQRDWALPHSSAFTRAELEAVYRWIHRGGGLLLITDHAPGPGAIADLASMLGVVLLDGAAREKDPVGPLPDVFSRVGGQLSEHALLSGRDVTERIEAVGTFAGAAFQASREWSPLLVFGKEAVAWVALGINFRDVPISEWPRFSVAGWFHAGARRVGEGRVVLLGEVSMCTALLDPKRQPIGMNHPQATGNGQFCLNSVRWLSGILGE